MLLPHTYKKSDLQKNCIHIIPNYLLHITRSFCVCKPPWIPLPPLTQGQTSSRAGRGILSDIKIGWRIKCTYSRVGILPVQEKMNNHICTISKYEVVMHV